MILTWKRKRGGMGVCQGGEGGVGGTEIGRMSVLGSTRCAGTFIILDLARCLYAFISSQACRGDTAGTPSRRTHHHVVSVGPDLRRDSSSQCTSLTQNYASPSSLPFLSPPSPGLHMGSTSTSRLFLSSSHRRSLNACCAFPRYLAPLPPRPFAANTSSTPKYPSAHPAAENSST